MSRAPETVIGRILDAAEAEFMRAGYEAASTNNITGAFGGSKATLFRHFPTKQLLLEAVLRRIAGRWRGRIAWEEIPTARPREWLAGFTAMTLDWILSEDVLFVGRLGIAEGHKFPDLQQVFAETAGRPLETVVADRLRAWTEQRKLACDAPDEDAVHFMDLAISGVVSRALYGAGVLAPARRLAHAMRVTDLFLDGRTAPEARATAQN